MYELRKLYEEVLESIDLKRFPVSIKFKVDDTTLYVRLYGTTCRDTGKAADLEFKRRLIVTQDKLEALQKHKNPRLNLA